MEENIRMIETTTRDLIVAHGSESIKIEDLALAMLVNALPAPYAALRILIESVDSPTMAFVKQRILDEEQRIIIWFRWVKPIIFYFRYFWLHWEIDEWIVFCTNLGHIRLHWETR